ncbi:MAG: TetR/AcrR family transcriptional regulator [Desulfobacterales bacterium]|nr:TetR/AcrR family transcriptional regulator [Desulfobacterales bacterium]
MDISKAVNQNMSRNGRKSLPPSMIKLAETLDELLKEKDFNSISAAEISRTAQVNESLIYRYFKDKRGVLHFLLHNYMIDFMEDIGRQLKQGKGALNKLKIIIRGHITMYDTNRVFAKILLLEVRNFPGYFESDTYELIKSYGRFMTAIINEGVESGEIRNDIPLSRIRNLIMGGIEHACMAPVIFGYSISDESVDDLVKLLFQGIASPGNT